MRAEPFRIEIPEASLADLRDRLARTRLPGDPGNTGWSYGVEQEWLRGMIDYWARDYDWRAAEAAMNALPQYCATIDGLPIHFVHLRAQGPSSGAIVLTHGWPWSFLDWLEAGRRLADPVAFGLPATPAFDVVIPSLPGFAFSAPLTRTGIGPPQIASVWDTLMRRVLGYPRYGAAGGDWGAMVTLELGLRHAAQLNGAYLALPVAPGLDGRSFTPGMFAPDEQWMPARRDAVADTLVSHIAVHMHDPQTLAYALADSPAGTAAWIWERRRAWSDCDGDVEALFGREGLCTLASLYWLTNTIGSSLRIYAEWFRPMLNATPATTTPRLAVPTAYGIGPKDIVFLPRRLAEAQCDLRRWTVFPRGGHFGPAEQPAAVAADIAAFFGSLGG
jgi:pimeloyl-ACP methyl ester carboxylesterase